MQRIANYLPSTEPTRATCDTPPNAEIVLSPSRLAIAELFVRLGAAYGHQWIAAHERDTGDVWLHGLQGLTPEQLGTGVAMCMQVSEKRVLEGGTDWPPSLGVFRGYCKSGTHRERQFFPALTRPAPDSKIMEGELQNMKSILGRRA